MPKVILTVYEAYLQAIADGALAEAQILSQELDSLSAEAQAINPIDNLVVG